MNMNYNLKQATQCCAAPANVTLLVLSRESCPAALLVGDKFEVLSKYVHVSVIGVMP